MLVLTRKEGEVIVIGGTIRLTVVEVRLNQVRLGLTAPPDVSVQRGELQRKAEGAGAEAGGDPGPSGVPAAP
jgi:carbon storage regulator